jgi:signal transduction histidine kinase/DNA-binding LacI/PurR family transcriptional regulator
VILLKKSPIRGGEESEVLAIIDGKMRRTIGVLMHSIDGSSNFLRYEGLIKKARDLDLDLLFFSEGMLQTAGSRKLYYDLALGNIDGLIAGISVNASCMQREELLDFFRNFKVPVVTINDLSDAFPAVVFDNRQGIRDVVTHFIAEHGLRRILFVRGPEDHHRSQECFQAYCETMREHGCYNPDLVSPVLEYLPHKHLSAKNSSNSEMTLRKFLGSLQPGKDFDAVVAVNDHWAIATIEILKSMNCRVPEDVGVAGYDDSVRGRTYRPALTSVSLPYFEQGSAALDLLNHLIKGDYNTLYIQLPSHLLIRHSCGCLASIDFQNLLPNAKDIRDEPPVTDHAANQNELIDDLSNLLFRVPSPKNKQMIDRLLNEFISDISGKTENAFCTDFYSLMENYLPQSEEFIKRQQVLALIYRKLFRRLSGAEMEKAEVILGQARLLYGFCILRNQELIDLRGEQRTREMSMLQADLNSILNRNELKELLAERLPLLGFESFFLIWFDHSEPSIAQEPLAEYSFLAMGYTPEGRIETPEEGLRFPTRQLLPDSLLNTTKPAALIVAPLFFREKQFGYIMFEIDSSAGKYYQFIHAQLNSSLWSIYLFEQQKRIEESLISQTYELAYSNAELRKFAYISSHDLQEPLRKIISFGDRLRECAREKLSPHELQYLERIQYSAMRMHVLINDLLAYYRIKVKKPPKKEINLSKICHEIISELEDELNRTGGKVEIWPLPVIKADPLQIRQVMYNLISNALKFHREGVDPLVIIYALPTTPGRALIVIDDNGIGINAAYYDKIFGVFERLHNKNEYEGSGIGLAICKKIIEQHGGKIIVDSEVGVGSKFMLDLPL